MESASVKNKNRKTSEFQRVMKRRRFLTIALAAALTCMTLSTSKPVRAAEEEKLFLHATSAVLIDGESGRVLYGKEENMALPNASTTKIMTCILVLEECDLGDTATVSGYAKSMPKVHLGMMQGEQYGVKDLLYSLMLESHNDSAVVLAEHVGKRFVRGLSDKEEKEFTKDESILAIKTFAGLMNRKAEMIGCKDTYFITPNGLDATETFAAFDGEELVREHHVTAWDLARILSYCILESPKRDEFLAITRKPSHSFTANGRWYVLQNHNAFLSMMDGALAGKTGFTGKAGYCYVGALLKDQRLYVIALLACGWPNHREYKWKDARTLFEYGIRNYERRDLGAEDLLMREEELCQISVLNGQKSMLRPGIAERENDPKGEAGEKADNKVGADAADKVILQENLGWGRGILLRRDETLKRRIELEKCVNAPIREGQRLGEIQYLLGDEVLFSENIVAKETVEKIDYLWCVKMVMREFLRWE